MWGFGRVRSGGFTVDIIDGNAGEGNVTLERYLNEREQLGMEVLTVLPNGLNRWTVICRKKEA